MFLVFSNFDFQFLIMTSRGGQYFYRFLSACRLIEYNSSIDELECNLRAEIAAITPEKLANVMQNARKRTAFCVSNGGGHLIDVVF